MSNWPVVGQVQGDKREGGGAGGEGGKKWYRVFVGGLPETVDDDKLKLLFDEFGEVLMAKVVCDNNTKVSRGFGFVTFETHDAAKSAIMRMNGLVLEERPLEVNWAILRRKKDKDENLRQHPKYHDVFHATFPGNSTIYVGNLPPGISKEAVQKLLQAAFRKYGYVRKVIVSECLKYAFIDFDTTCSATCAILAMNGKALCGAEEPGTGLKSIRCNWANTQHDSGRSQAGRPPSGYPTNNAVEPAYDTSAGFWTANGRTRSTDFNYRTNPQNMLSWFWDASSGYGSNNGRAQYTNPNMAGSYGSYYGYNSTNYRNTYYGPPGQGSSGNVTTSTAAEPSSSTGGVPLGRYTTSISYNRPQQQQYQQQGYSSSLGTSGSTYTYQSQSQPTQPGPTAGNSETYSNPKISHA